jgi:2-succinyl-5-enolpyruvyl-6-hydroxy-3-cyclohexene-1-carboxylate synthase
LAAEVIAGQFDAPSPEGLGGEWFEGRVFAELAGLLPANALQYTASSMPVRDLDAFTPRNDTPVRHLVNRGANGIDGTVSSALGAAAAAQAQAAAQKEGAGPAVLVTGDLAFYHDSNGLLAAKQYGLNLTIVLINNNGGGIFEMLPVSQFGETYEKHFGTPHGIDFSSLARAYDLQLLKPADWPEFREMVGASLAEPGTRIVEICTDRARNREQHEQIWQAVAGRLEQAFPAGRVME